MPPTINGNVQLNPAQNTIQEQPVNTEQTNAPRELANAKSSGWKTFGRVAAGIFTLGFSELIPLAWKGIKALFSRSSQAPNGEPRVTGQANALPAAAPEADRLKSSLLDSLKKSNALPEQYQQAADEVLSDLRGTYGSALVPEGMHVNDLLKQAAAETGMQNNAAFFKAVRNSANLVSPEGFKDLLRNNLQPMLNCQVLVNQGKDIAKDLAIFSRVEVKTAVGSLLKKPGISAELNNAKSPAEAAAVGEKIKLAEMLHGINNALVDTVNSLREKYGENALPENPSAVLDMNCTTGGVISSKVFGLMSSGNIAVTPQSVKETLSGELVKIAQANVLQVAIKDAAQDIGLHMNDRALAGITADLLGDEAVSNLMKSASNSEEVRTAVEGLNLKTLLQTQKQEVEAVYNQHASSVSDDMKPLLKEFISGLPLVGKSAEASKQYLAEVMPHFQNWQTFTGTEPGREQINDVFKQVLVDDYSKLADAPGEAHNYDNSIYKTMLVDSNRGRFTINGQKITGHTVEESSANMKPIMVQEFPNEKDRQFVSKIMNQRIWANLAMPHSAGMLPNGQPFSAVPGGTGITYVPGKGGETVHQAIAGKSASYSVQISEDKTTARITMTSPFSLAYADNSRFNGKPIVFGGKTVSFTFDVNLSAHPDGQGITNVAFGQKLLSMEEYMNL
jgi:hypothetical protein